LQVGNNWYSYSKLVWKSQALFLKHLALSGVFEAGENSTVF